MKKILPFILIVALAISTMAQNMNEPEGFRVMQEQVGPDHVRTHPQQINIGQKAFSSVVIGDTWYDAQTINYGSVMPRMFAYQDGTVGAIWQSAGQDLVPDRGTGYNYYDGSEWGTPDPHVGNDDRTGTPSYSAWGPNGEIFCHYWYTGNEPGPIRFYKRATKGEGEWVETILNGPDDLSIVWHSMTTSGPNNEHIHLLADTYDADYMGQTNALIYYRSSDGAETWDIEGVIIEGLGIDYFPTINHLSYNWAHGVGNTIAFTYGFDEYGGLVFKSDDNGDSWTKLEVYVTPWDPFETYTDTDDFGCGPGNSAIALDSQGKVHVVFPKVVKTWTGGSSQWQPFTDGLIYWNEDMPRLDTTTISSYTNEFLEDGGNICGWILADEPYTIDDNQPNYGTGACGFPQISIRSDDKMFISWSGLAPDYHTGGSPDLFYRHIIMNASFDGGNTWNGPIDINTEIQWILSDCIYSSMPPYFTGDMVHVMFQEDNIPGTFEWPNEQTTATENRIYHMDFPVSFFVGVDEIEPTPNFEVSQIYPNPANTTARFGLKLEEKSNVSVDVLNVVGQVVKKIELGTLNTGNHPVELQVSDMKAGIYYIAVTVGQRKLTQKILIQ